jgi:hypothetical protein
MSVDRVTTCRVPPGDGSHVNLSTTSRILPIQGSHWWSVPPPGSYLIMVPMSDLSTTPWSYLLMVPMGDLSITSKVLPGHGSHRSSSLRPPGPYLLMVPVGGLRTTPQSYLVMVPMSDLSTTTSSFLVGNSSCWMIYLYTNSWLWSPWVTSEPTPGSYL